MGLVLGPFCFILSVAFASKAMTWRRYDWEKRAQFAACAVLLMLMGTAALGNFWFS